MIYFFLSLLLATCFGDEISTLKGAKVALCQLQDRAQQKWVLDVQATTDLDIWSMKTDAVEVLLRPNDPTSDLIKATLQCKVTVDDVYELIQSSMQPNPNLLGDFYDQYPTYDEIVSKLRNIAATYPSLARFNASFGQSIQNRSIPFLIIGSNTSAPRWNIVVQGGMHAREWASPTTVIYLAEALCANYSRLANVTSIMDRVNFHIWPMANPDGYVYSQSCTDCRMWRKNRRLNTGGSYGVDLNRNWACHWGGAGSSGTPSSDTYRGTEAASEPETKAARDYALSLPRRLAGVDYHAYGPLILRSWGWTTTASSDESWLAPIGAAWSAAIKAVHGVTYTSEKAAELYVASGGDDDWWSNTTTNYGAAIPGHGWTVEVRGNSFLLPVAQIRPCGEENFNGFIAFTQQLLSRFGNPSQN